MENKELIDFVNNELPSDNEWWDSENANAFHKACNIMLDFNMDIEIIKVILSELYSAVSNEYN